jgi:diguanylate cyclase (GGDEF)-like protein
LLLSTSAPPSGDRYYWLTAILAAGGNQTAACRGVAATITGLGIIPVALIGSTAGPHGTRDTLLAVAIGVCCVAMGALWLRRCWPTRRQSQLCAAVGSVCIAVASLIAAQPAVGLLGSTAFAVLSGYIAICHSGRLLAFVWAAAGVTLAVLAVRLAATDLAVALTSVALVALINIFVATVCRLLIRMVNRDVIDEDIDPLTGLLHRDAFVEQVASIVGARTRDDDRYLVVMVLTLDGFSLLTGMRGDADGDQACVAIAQNLRETVRRDAVVAHVGEAEFLVAELFTTADCSPLAERIRGTIASVPYRLTASIGTVSTPSRPLAEHPPHDVCEEILTIAGSAMYEARRAGGNQARHVRCPTLTILDDRDPGADDEPA